MVRDGLLLSGRSILVCMVKNPVLGSGSYIQAGSARSGSVILRIMIHETEDRE
jgi:hypothetical protein